LFGISAPLDVAACIDCDTEVYWNSGAVPSAVAILLERRNGPRRLREIDDDDDDLYRPANVLKIVIHRIVVQTSIRLIVRAKYYRASRGFSGTTRWLL